MSVPQQMMKDVEDSLKSLIGVQLDIIHLHKSTLLEFEPSQIGTIVGTLVDGCIPTLDKLYSSINGLGLRRASKTVGEREGYPDFDHISGARLELKTLYVPPQNVKMKTPPSPREPSGRLTQKVTLKNVIPTHDLLLVLAYQLAPLTSFPDIYAPTFIDTGLFPMIECIQARDHRLISAGGKWFGNYETPAILSTYGSLKVNMGQTLIDEYGRKESEEKDYNEDTNFGKLKRIPYKPLQEFLKKHGCHYMMKGEYPESWTLNDSNKVT
jgi:hypothetical protein